MDRLILVLSVDTLLPLTVFWALMFYDLSRNDTMPGITKQYSTDGNSGTTPTGAGGAATFFHPSWRSRRVIVFWSCTFLVATLVWWTFTGIHLRSLSAGNTLLGTLLYPLFGATTLTWSRLLRGTSLTIGATRLVYATRGGSTSVRWCNVAVAVLATNGGE